MKTSAMMLAVSMCLALPGRPVARQEEPDCYSTYSFVAPDAVTFRPARIKGSPGQRAHFFADEGACPNGRNCRKNSYLIPGDDVIVSSGTGTFVCAWFQPKKGTETIGWMSSDAIEFVDVNRSPQLAEWLGEWRYRDNSLRIVGGANTGELAVTGGAIWYGAGDNVHVGEIEATGAPKGNVVKLAADADENECKATLWLIGTRLVAKDNGNCGGVNVFFAGVYSKTAG